MALDDWSSLGDFIELAECLELDQTDELDGWGSVSPTDLVPTCTSSHRVPLWAWRAVWEALASSLGSQSQACLGERPGCHEITLERVLKLCALLVGAEAATLLVATLAQDKDDAVLAGELERLSPSFFSWMLTEGARQEEEAAQLYHLVEVSAWPCFCWRMLSVWVDHIRVLCWHCESGSSVSSLLLCCHRCPGRPSTARCGYRATRCWRRRSHGRRE